MKKKSIRALSESALTVALALALSYLKIPIGFTFGGFGGSIDLVMLPLIICACRWGTGFGLCAGLVFGTLKFFFAGGVAVNWESMLLDYSVAYMFVGFAGLIRSGKRMWLAALIGASCRFLIHFLSGITIYADYMYDIFGLPMSNVWIYSLLYNLSYMLPNTVLAVLLSFALQKPLRRILAE